MKFNKAQVKQLHIEASSVCNAACPMCPREVNPFFNKDTDGVSITLEQIQEKFNDDFIKQLELVYLCGSYGDPAACPDCIKILKYFRQTNDRICLGIHSNGGLRNTKWWAELGAVLNRPGDYCRFGIDGLRDTNHIYRVNTDFDKIIENAQSYIAAGGQAIWEFIVFEHNEHQVEEARKMSKELGFANFIEKVSRRFSFIQTNLRPPRGAQYR